jgi:hypothetical protein
MLCPQRSVPASNTAVFRFRPVTDGGSYRQVRAVETPLGRYRAGMVAEG